MRFRVVSTRFRRARVVVILAKHYLGHVDLLTNKFLDDFSTQLLQRYAASLGDTRQVAMRSLIDAGAKVFERKRHFRFMALCREK